MAKVVYLVEREVSGELVKALETMLADVHARKMIGMAVIAMYIKQEYTVDIVGETERNPIFTRGMLSLLDDELSKIIAGTRPGL